MKTTVHFSVEAKGIVELARSMWWDEHEYVKAYRIVAAMNADWFPDEIIFDILAGRKTLLNKTRDSICLKPDKWHPSKYAKAHSCEPSLEAIMQWASLGAKAALELEERRKRDKAAMEELDAQEEAEEAKDANREESRSKLSAVQQLMKRQDELTEEAEKPIQPDDFILRSGWMSPAGQWYSADWMEHIYVIGRLGYAERRAESDGWLKISVDCIFVEDRPTQAQLDKLFDWCQKFGLDYQKDVIEKYRYNWNLE